MDTKKVSQNVIIGIVVILALVFIFKIYIIVEPGERAVIFNKATGNLRITPGEGFYLLIPLVEEPTVYDVKVKTYTMSSISYEGEVRGDDSLQALTADGQNVYLDISVRFHPDEKKLIDLHKKIGKDYINKVIRPQVRSIGRLVVSEFPVVDVYSGQRKKIQDRIAQELKKTFEENYIVLNEVLLRNVRFTDAFQKAIENKQIAQQEAQRMEYVLKKQKMEKERKIIEAQGEAEAIRLKGKALAENPVLIKYEYVKLLSPKIQAIITDQNTIINFSDLLKKKK